MSSRTPVSPVFGQEVAPLGRTEGRLRSVVTVLMLILLAALSLLGIWAGEPLAVSLGALVFLIILIARLWTRVALFDLSYAALPSRDRLMLGEDFELTIDVENRKFLPLPWLRLVDYIPAGIDAQGPISRFSSVPGTTQIESTLRLGGYERIRVPKHLKAVRRGVYRFGPARMVVSDLFGFYEAAGDVPLRSREVVVYPRVLPISSFPLPTARPMGDDQSRHPLIADPTRPVGTREYRVGDRVRDIDWKVTAKHSEPFVRTYESSLTGHVVVLLECRNSNRPNLATRNAALEDCVSAAASLAAHLFDRGYGLGLVTNGSSPGEAGPTVVPPAGGPHQLAALLKALAGVRASAACPLEEVVAARGSEALPFGCTIIYVTAQVHEDSLEFLRPYRAMGCALTVAYAGRAAPPDTTDVTLVDLRAVPGLVSSDEDDGGG